MLGSFLMSYQLLDGQNSNNVDSLELVFSENRYEENDRLNILNQLAVKTIDAERKLAYSEQLIESALALDNSEYLYKGYFEKGNALSLKSELSEALENYFLGAKYAVDQNIGLGKIYISIADVYSQIGNNRNSLDYYNKAISLLRIKNDSINIATALLNTGDEYFNINQLDTARIYTEEAAIIFKKINYPLGQAYALGNIGMIYAEEGKNIAAENNMSQAIEIMEQEGDFYPIAVYLTYISDIYQNKGDHKTALNYANQSLKIAKAHGLKQEISDANLKLSELYENANNTTQSLKFYKDYITYRDSVNNLDAVHKMADLRTDFEVSQKQVEVDLLNQEKKTQRIIRNGLIIFLGLISLLLLALYRFYKAADKEKKRSEKLLLNILPAKTAEELKENGKVAARKFESVTVLFTDFVGFTKYSESLSPEELVEIIDFYFSKFDEIVEKYGLEKIKTIGDAYMCAGGLPFPSEDHAIKMIHAALDITNFVKEERLKQGVNKMPFDIRLGINTGPLVAGVVGFKKFAYDIWGDTVNIASRLETNSEIGKINISQSTYDLIKNDFNCNYRGEVDVKYKGLMKMYFVEGIK